MLPKRNQYRNEGFLDYVRAHACCACLRSGPSVAHHFMENSGGMAMKVDDTFTVPLCKSCHDCWHDHRYLPCFKPEADEASFRIAVDRSRALQYQAQARLLSTWIQMFGMVGPSEL